MTSSPANWFSSQIFHKIYEGILNFMRVRHYVRRYLLPYYRYLRTKVLLMLRRSEGTKVLHYTNEGNRF